MAGNLVKWWKHKILGGYKQFSVQECTTDSEELMYQQVRASSSCSAPPDLLLVSDRENNLPLRSAMVHVIGAATATPSSGANSCPVMASGNNNQKVHQHHHHQQPHQHQQQQKPHSISSKDISGKHQPKTTGGKQVPQEPQQQSLENEAHVDTQQNYTSTRQTHHHHQQRSEEHIRLEEFTCDVSVEGGKSSQPLQFSFTFYDLDGHHGKITKDDIVGIVYTIYESIGKSVVVPHSGSKTINVRLTVSPEGKSKASKSSKKVAPNSVTTADQQNVTSQKGVAVASGRRLHRYRPRKLIKSDEDDDDDSNSDKERETSTATNANTTSHLLMSSKSSTVPKTRVDQQCCQLPPHVQSGVDVNIHDSIYDQPKKGANETCRECLAAVEETRNAALSPTHNDHTVTTHIHNNGKSVANEAYMKHVASTRIKMLRKSRKQKYQDCMQTRQRSLSVGSETCWNNRHLQKAPQHQLPWNVDQQLNNTDVLDGVQLRNPLQMETTPISQKRNSAECWKTALNRNDLISIIRESMEKNRLCFQLNGKPQANVSPIRQSTRQPQQHLLQHKHSQHQPRQRPRQRSNTVSKIPMLISNHNNRSSSFTNNNDSSLNEHRNSNSIFHLQPHIPIYHHQMGINPTVVAAQNGINVVQKGSGVVAAQHSKVNLCGYDSFLHATICGGGLSHSPPPHTQQQNNQQGVTSNSHHSHHQQIATVQPIIPSYATNCQSTSKNMGLSMGANQIKTSKILRSASYSQGHQTANAMLPSSQNSPQYHGYQRLASTNKQNLTPLNLIHHNSDKSQMEMSADKCRKDQLQNYDQLLYAKLAEKLQQTSLATTNKESIQRRKHRVLRHRRSNGPVSLVNKVGVPTEYPTKTSDYTTLIPFVGDPVECENLIVQTSDEESHSQLEIATGETTDNQIVSNMSASTRHVAEGTLVDLEDADAEDLVNAVKHSISTNMSTVDPEENELHLEDDLEIDDELNEDLADLEEIAITESGRNSSFSNDPNGVTIANTNSANTSATSSLIHRYVHEHIHHHYHHFEEKDE